MLGIVLAAGGGTRLRPLTDTLPKTLLPVEGDRTIFELAIANLRAVDITDVVVVTGHGAKLIDDAATDLERRYGLTLHPVFNDRYADWNNAYSLWLARDAFRESALLINGRLMTSVIFIPPEPPAVSRALHASRSRARCRRCRAR